MINYFIDLLKKPHYQWALLDDLAITGLVIGIVIIIFAVWFLIWFIRELKKEKRYKTCKQWRLGTRCWHHQNCLGCRYYKKKEQIPHQHEDEGE